MKVTLKNNVRTVKNTMSKLDIHITVAKKVYEDIMLIKKHMKNDNKSEVIEELLRLGIIEYHKENKKK